jgi:YD repeat-containing protein
LFRILNTKGHQTVYRYDEADRKIGDADNTGNYSVYTYDKNSNPVPVDRYEVIKDQTTGAIIKKEVFSTINQYDELDRKISNILLATTKSIKQTSYLKIVVARDVKRDDATRSKNKHGMVQLLNSKMQQQQIEWRRSKVLELSSQGHTQIEIATNLQVDGSIVSRDMAYLKQKAHENLKTHIQDKLPEEYQNCMVGINQVLKICWDIVNKSRIINIIIMVR